MTEPIEHVDPTWFRQVLGRFATGIVVLAAVDDGTPYGMAANSFTSVSLSPPLVGFCADLASTTWPHLKRAGRFTVSVLGEHQEDVSRLFATKGADRFAGTAWTTTPGGRPALAGALAVLDCRIEAVHPAGDHELVLGHVEDLAVDPDEQVGPLLYFRGRYSRIGTGA